jgi:hypothetical protein
MPVRGLAFRRDLYTVSVGDRELDDFEHWISEELEPPANVAVEKVLDGERLKREDWHSLAQFLAIQDVRTPRSFIEMTNRWEKELPDVLEDSMREAVKEFESAKKNGTPLRQNSEDNEFSAVLNVAIDQSQSQATINAEAVIGRRMWIAAMRHLLSGRAVETLRDHQWTIAEPAGDMEWPLTDHPVLKLNYSGPDNYNFGGGWGRRLSDLMMPLSPRHLLFVEVGRDSGRKVTLTAEATRLFQRLLVERAHRWVFATKPLEWVLRIRPRKVDADAFAAEKVVWERWHPEQSQAEISGRT